MTVRTTHATHAVERLPEKGPAAERLDRLPFPWEKT
jgi:hypothetical protein